MAGLGFEGLWKAASTLDQSISTENVLATLSNYVPESFTLSELRDEVKSHPDQEIVLGPSGLPSEQNPLNLLRGLLACLQAGSRIKRNGDDSRIVKELASSVSRLIAPTNNQDADQGEVGIDELYEQVAKRYSSLAGPGVGTLKCLADLVLGRLPDDVLITLIAYTDPREGWTDPGASTAARTILAQQLSDRSVRDRFLVHDILEDYLRPLFSKSRPSTVTASGRKAEFTDASDTERGLPEESGKTKPWKYKELGSTAVTSWAVEEANEELISKNWPLFIPVLLTLVDDSTTSIRARGLGILAEFIDKFSAKLISDTGLFKIFEDAVFPTLMFLPNVTPEEESIQLLPPAYKTLICLGQKLGPETHMTSKKQKFVDKVMREGILAAYSHASTHIRVVNVLLQVMPDIMRDMGIQTMRHLKDLVPMLAAIITDPFSMSDTNTLRSAIEALQVAVALAHPAFSVGPRADAWQTEIVRILVICWLNACEETETVPSQATLDMVKQELRTTAQILSAVMSSGEGSSLLDRVASLVSKHPALKELFGAST